MTRLALASTSPYRKELLTRLGLPFETAAPDVDESAKPGETALSLVLRLSEAKARAVAPQFPGAWIIGSDQVAVLDGAIVGKPGNRDGAMAQLRAASGRRLPFHTGLCLLSPDGRAQVEAVDFAVVFRSLSEAEIANYVDRDQPYGCAGSFKSEGLGITLFSAMEGSDPTSLLGLPLIRLTQLLIACGVSPLDAANLRVE
ncbi:Maf family protein [Magnetofaba australis]|uniref:7-methyl-GTP pyrophosphatase n=1 Tax=Magnetofaba australis IT-1 TaxID=1434232 RepID=A0A1Y2K4L2_9PROT|nr:nucleoside triphosphate pyrophosphatase [Magnetofaba australis]OSM01955.1 putative Maf-like protein [Magnetofaba australis IT-1]